MPRSLFTRTASAESHPMKIVDKRIIKPSLVSVYVVHVQLLSPQGPSRGHKPQAATRHHRQMKHINGTEKYKVVHAIRRESEPLPKLEASVMIKGLTYDSELDTGVRTNFITSELRHQLGKPPLQDIRTQYASANQRKMPIIGEFREYVSSPTAERECDMRLIINSSSSLD